MAPRSAIHLALAISFFIITSLTTSTLAQQNTADELDQSELKDIWKKVAQVNQVWLDPQPQSLSYKIVSGSPPPAEPDTTQLVWLSGDKARWEMETGDEPNRLKYTMILTPLGSRYLRGPELLLKKGLKPQPLNALRQGITWRTGFHILQESGLPEDAKVVSESKDGSDGLVVVQATSPARSNVGLGLYHTFHGSSQWPTGKIKLTLRLPDHVPLREEFANGTVIEYGPDFFQVGNGLAPKSMRFTTRFGSQNQPWILAADFQVVEGVWLLKSARNLQKGILVKQMDVQDVSVLPIADDKFAVPEKVD